MLGKIRVVYNPVYDPVTAKTHILDRLLGKNVFTGVQRACYLAAQS